MGFGLAVGNEKAAEGKNSAAFAFLAVGKMPFALFAFFGGTHFAGLPLSPVPGLAMASRMAVSASMFFIR